MSSARFTACGKPGVGRVKFPFGRHSPVTCSAPSYLKPVSIGLSDTNRCVIRIASAQVTQLLGYNSRGQTLDRLCAPAIKFTVRTSGFTGFRPAIPDERHPIIAELLSRPVLTVLPLLDRQRQCRRALATLDFAGGQFCGEDVQHTAPFSELGPVYYARRPCPRPKEHEPLVLCMGGKKGAQNPARPYLKLVS